MLPLGDGHTSSTRNLIGPEHNLPFCSLRCYQLRIYEVRKALSVLTCTCHTTPGFCMLQANPHSWRLHRHKTFSPTLHTIYSHRSMQAWRITPLHSQTCWKCGRRHMKGFACKYPVTPMSHIPWFGSENLRQHTPGANIWEVTGCQ